MAESPSPSAPSSVGGEDRLDSWKEIAAYLNRDVTTVQRWEKREGMPVHRHLHDKVGSVYASRAELDAWTRIRSRAAEENLTEIDPPAAPSLTSTKLSRSSRILVLSLSAVLIVAATSTTLWLRKSDHFWQNPIANARFQTVTDFEGVAQAATISRDGHLIAFLSDRDGPMDVWVTQVGSGQFHNLTHGSVDDLVNPAIRALAFSPDSSLVTFWVRKQDGTARGNISIWAVPTLGGEPRPYLENVGDLDWSPDGSRLVYHRPVPGDTLFVSYVNLQAGVRQLYIAPDGLHCHFPLWSPDSAFIYFVRGLPPDQLDVWRIASAGGTPERMTYHNSRVTHPILLDRHTLLYLATDADGAGPWLYGMDVDRRIPHRLNPGLDQYTSLATSEDHRHLVLTVATPKRTLWRSRIADSGTEITAPVPVSLTTNTGFSPRLGANYLLYVSTSGGNQSIWKLIGGTSRELWNSNGAQLVGGPAISRDGQRIAFSVRQSGKTLLYVMQSDGTQARTVTDSLDLQGSPAWAPDGQAIITSANDRGTPHLYRVPLDGRLPDIFVPDYSRDPAWAHDGNFVVFSGPEIGITFPVKAVRADGVPHPLPSLTLTRGARHVAFLPEGQRLVLLRGDIQHKNLWIVDLATGAERQLASFPPEFDVRDFDISPDGTELIFERVQERSDVVLLDLLRR